MAADVAMSAVAMTPTLRTEYWIAHRLERPDLLSGITTPTERRERVRTVILNRNLSTSIVDEREGARQESWAALFVRVYGEPLRGHEAAA
jgi:hypothetical protein